MKKIAIGFFKAHPTVDTFFFTSDEQAFFTKQAAENHAGSLPKDDRDITTVTRAEAEGDDDKAGKAKEKAIEVITGKIADAKAELADVTGKANAEKDDTKKQGLALAVTNATAEVERLEAELADLNK